MMNVLLAAGASAAANHARFSHQLVYALAPILILAVSFDVYCLIDLIRAAGAPVRVAGQLTGQFAVAAQDDLVGQFTGNVPLPQPTRC